MDTFKRSLPMMLHNTLDTIIPQYRAVFKQQGITEQQWRILRVLWEKNSVSATELASITLLPKPSMVGILNRMVNKGLIARAPNSEDRRKIEVSLTDKGRIMQSELMPHIDQVNQDIMALCGDKTWKNMINTLQTIIDSKQ